MSALEKLKQLEPIQFRYKAELDPTQPLRAGFSAQQVQQVIPEAVHEVDGVLMIDLNVLKTFSFGFGELKLSNYFSYLYKNDIQLSSTIAKEECRGKYENTCGLPSPEIQNILSLSFMYKILNFDTSTSLSARYIDGVEDTNSFNPINFSSY